jgi:elongator complex protein 2
MSSACGAGHTEWHEVARAQVHGYDVFALATLRGALASAADEKVVRVFRAPHNFLLNYRNLCGEDFGLDDQGPFTYYQP